MGCSRVDTKRWRRSFTLAAVVDGDKIEVEDCIAAVAVEEGGGEVIVALAGGADLVDGYSARLRVNFEHDVTMDLLPLISMNWGWGEGLTIKNYAKLLISERESKGQNMGVKSF